MKTLFRVLGLTAVATGIAALLYNKKNIEEVIKDLAKSIDDKEFKIPTVKIEEKVVETKAVENADKLVKEAKDLEKKATKLAKDTKKKTVKKAEEVKKVAAKEVKEVKAKAEKKEEDI